MKSLIISHLSDYDGAASAAICNTVLTMIGYECSILGVDRKESLLPSGDALVSMSSDFDFVFLCDFSFDPATMLSLKDTGKLVWIDHHKTAIEDSDEHGYADVRGLRSTGLSASELAHEYLIHEFTNLANTPDGAKTPECIELLGKQDTFRKGDDWDTRVLPFHCYMMSRFQEFKIGSPAFTENWYELLKCKSVEPFIEAGKSILSYRRSVDSDNASSVHRLKFNEFPDMEFLAINGRNSSGVFDGVPSGGTDGMVSYYFNGADWSFSLYGWDNSPDLSVISTHFGGGGHRGASGFRASDLSHIVVSVYKPDEISGETALPTEAPFNVSWDKFIPDSQV